MLPVTTLQLDPHMMTDAEDVIEVLYHKQVYNQGYTNNSLSTTAHESDEIRLKRNKMKF